ncbi:MAG: response regulator [Desulfobacterales bacterium]|nr:MAG: response regulator [Desulfobacterales bacterium]
MPSASKYMDLEKLLARIEYLENNRRYIQKALDMVLSLGDFQENIDKGDAPLTILQQAESRIRHLIPFEANTLYLADEDNSDFIPAVCIPSELKHFLADEVAHMINQGFFAWAIRERRGLTIDSKDHSRKFLLHVIATYSRIRGMFVGLLPDQKQSLPDTSLTILSIILQNTANALESLAFYNFLRNQNQILEKRIEERTKALEDSNRQLQQVLKIQAIGTLAGGIAHDFNNILFPIIGYTELSLDEIPPASPAQGFLEEVLKAANRAKDLVQQILTFSRQNGQERKPVHVQHIVKEVLKLLRASIPANLEIIHRLDEDCGPILGDATQIHQVIMNLSTNAYHAMQEIGGALDISLTEVDIGYEEPITGTGIKPGRHLRLTVKDVGHGMEPAVMERIFEPYYTTKEPGKGTGLGLAVIHGIVKNHGGDIRVTSKPGEGTTFHVYLPLMDRSPAEPEAPVPNVAKSGNEHVLLVEDEKQVIDMERQMLERLGYRVTARTSSHEALAVFGAQPDNFDLVITDMTMPHMTGERLARQLIEIRPNIPIILCTGFNEGITEDKALAMGIRKFVMKPVVKNDLALTIRAVLDRN